MGDTQGKEGASESLSRRDFLKVSGAGLASLALKPFESFKPLPPEDQPPPPKEQYTQAEWFAIRSLPEGAVDTVFKRGVSGIGLPVVKRSIVAIEGRRYANQSPLAREFPTYSLVEVRRVLEQLNSSTLYDVTPFFMPQWDPTYLLPVMCQRVAIDPETGAEQPNWESTNWENLYIPDEKIRLGRGLLGENWMVKTTEELPPNRKLEITWIGKRTPFEIDAGGKLVFDPTRRIVFYSEIKQDPQGTGSYYKKFSGVSPTGALYLPVEMSVTPEPQSTRPGEMEA